MHARVCSGHAFAASYWRDQAPVSGCATAEETSAEQARALAERAAVRAALAARCSSGTGGVAQRSHRR